MGLAPAALADEGAGEEDELPALPLRTILARGGPLPAGLVGAGVSVEVAPAGFLLGALLEELDLDFPMVPRS